MAEELPQKRFTAVEVALLCWRFSDDKKTASWSDLIWTASDQLIKTVDGFMLGDTLDVERTLHKNAMLISFDLSVRGKCERCHRPLPEITKSRFCCEECMKRQTVCKTAARRRMNNK